MRILMYPMGSSGDVHPFVGLGKALQARGHEPFLITSGYFEDLAGRAGIPFRAVGTREDFERAQEDPDLWHPKKAFNVLVEKALNHSYAPILEYARELNKPGETVMLAGTLAFGARNARDLLDIPLASVHLAPCLFLSRYRQPMLHGAPIPQWAPGFLKAFQWWAGGKVADKAVLPELNRFRASHGLPPVRDIIRSWWHSPDRVLGLFPDWFGPPQPDWPKQTRLTGFPMFDEKGMHEMPPEVESFLQAGEPPVVFTPGSAMAHGHDFFAQAVEALKLTGRRGLLITRFRETVPAKLPETVMHASYIPFSEVLPRAAALVYHGGVGTCAQALRAGIPHLIYHMAHDQLDNLSRVRDLGVGDGLAPKQFKAARIAKVLNQLLDNPENIRRAKQISERFDTEAWMRQTCELVEQVVLSK
ncbi:MAG: glycosyltransferase [Planctomycetes bacterium]|nr:glycosyltransferase [Planctomycetota bacterium]